MHLIYDNYRAEGNANLHTSRQIDGSTLTDNPKNQHSDRRFI